MKGKLLAALGLLSCAGVQAQITDSAELAALGLLSYAEFQAQITDSAEIAAVRIQSERISQTHFEANRNIQIISAEQIRKMSVTSVAEVLAWVSGMDVRQRGPWGAQSDISIQGGSFEQSLVLIDGIRMTDPQTGHNMMNIPIPLEAIERIEILKGAAARIYGINALTGAINIITKKAAIDFAQVRTYVGSSFDKDTSNDNTFNNYGIAAATGFKAGNWNQLFSAGIDKGNGYRYNTGYTNYKFFSSSRYTFSEKSNLQLLGGYVNNSFGANAFYAAPGDKESEEAVETGLAAGRWSQRVGNFVITPEIAWRYNYDHYIYIRQKPAVFQNRHYTHSITPAIHARRNTAFGQYAFGAEHRQDLIRSNNLGRRERSNTGFSGEILWNKNPRIYGLLGVYALYNSDFGWGVFPGLELGYTLGENTKLFFNTGTAQRIPSFTDLYYRGPSNISNPNLQPENSRSGELGFRSVRSKGMIQATVFLRQINGMVDWVKDSIQKPWSPVNYNATRTPGIDINGNIHILQRQGLFLSLYAGYTYLQQGFVNEVAKTYSKNILENLKHQALLQARLRIGEHFNMNAGVRYIQRETMAAYTLCDLHLQYAFKRFSVYTNINNITNIQFREIAAVPMPPRWISLGLRYDLN